MHASVEQLLSLRDGELLGADALEHIADCDTCARKLEQLRIRREQLRTLPLLDPPRQAWKEIEQAIGPARSSRKLIMVRAVAAGVVLCMSLVGIAAYLHQEDLAAPLVVQDVTSGSSPDQAQVASLVGRSRELEEELRALPQRPSVQRASTAAAIDTLQARIEWVDTELSSAAAAIPDTRQLWRERVNLLDSLVKVRDAEASVYEL